MSVENVESRNSDERTQFEHFPPEIIYLIFNYLTGNEIFQSFSQLNHHFDSLVQNLRLNTIDLSSYSHQQIIEFFKCSYDHISPYMHSIKFSNHILQSNSCSANIELTFSLLIDNERLHYFCTNLQQIIFVRPIMDTTICLPDIILQSFLIYSSEDKIIFRKTYSQTIIASIMICHINTLRSILADHGGICNEIIIYSQNSILDRIIPFVRHLKVYIDDYDQQWIHTSQFFVNSLTELTILIIDRQFTSYDGQTFSSLLPNLSNHCQLHFYLQVRSLTSFRYQANVDTLVQSFQTEFYAQHQCNVIIHYSRDFLRRSFENWLLIYTSPCCTSKLTLIDQGEMIGVCSNYNCVNQLVFDSCVPTIIDSFPSNLLPNVTSLQLTYSSDCPFRQWFIPVHNNFSETIARIQHMHCSNAVYLEYLLKKTFQFQCFQHLRYLDITDKYIKCTILYEILKERRITMNVFHLNIMGSCRLQIRDIEAISKEFRNLQTLQFSMNFLSFCMDQLDTIGQYILINMRSHLHYVHIHFDDKVLMNISAIPSEMQLSDWLGRNQERFSHLQAIELTRKELFAWL